MEGGQWGPRRCGRQKGTADRDRGNEAPVSVGIRAQPPVGGGDTDGGAGDWGGRA